MCCPLSYHCAIPRRVWLHLFNTLPFDSWSWQYHFPLTFSFKSGKKMFFQPFLICCAHQWPWPHWRPPLNLLLYVNVCFAQKNHFSWPADQYAAGCFCCKGLELSHVHLAACLASPESSFTEQDPAVHEDSQIPFCKAAARIAESQPLSLHGVIQSHGQDFAFVIIRKEIMTQTPVLASAFFFAKRKKCFGTRTHNTRYNTVHMAR